MSEEEKSGWIDTKTGRELSKAELDRLHPLSRRPLTATDILIPAIMLPVLILLILNFGKFMAFLNSL